MDRYDPFEKLSDLYDSIVDWQNDPLIKPDNQNKYLFSDGKTYYEELCKILKLLSTFKTGFNQIYDNLDELEEQIHQSGVTQEELETAINNLHTVITGEIATLESSLSSDISDLDTSLTALTGRVGTNETNISALQTLTSTHTSDINTINTAITSIQADLLTKISDAPQDGKTYGRKNGTWTEVTGGGGGGTSDYDALDNKPQINGNILTGNKTGAQLGLADASALNSYVAKTDAPGYNDILTQTNAQLIYQTIQAMANYLQKTDVPGYGDILTKTDASTIYQTILAMNDYLLKNDAPGYADILTKTSASTLYQTISGMSAYLTSAVASSTYQTKTGMSAYLKKTDAPGYADILTKALASATYMPIDRKASTSQLGGVKVGDNLTIDPDGTLNAQTGSSTPFSFVGMVIQATNLDTLTKVQNIYGSNTTWALKSSVALASNLVSGNGLTLGMTDGTVTGGMLNNPADGKNVNGGYLGANVGSGVAGGVWITQAKTIGVATKTQLGSNPENSGLIADTFTVYVWERTA